MLRARIPSGLHSAVAEDTDGVPTLQQGVGVREDRTDRRLQQRRLALTGRGGTEAVQARLYPLCRSRSYKVRCGNGNCCEHMLTQVASDDTVIARLAQPRPYSSS